MHNATSGRVGISTATFFPMDTFEAFKLCCELGFKNIEVFINTLGETKEEFANRIKQTADSYGVNIISIHPFFSGFEYMLFFSSYTARLEDSIKLYRNFFAAASRLGAKYVVLHGDRAGYGAVTPEQYVEIFDAINKAAGEYGVLLTQENVSWCSSGKPDFIRQLRAISGDRMSFTFDYKQAMRGGVNPFDMIDAMGEQIVNVHINSWDKNVCRLPFAGENDTSKVLDRILSYNYIGSFLIEVYRENFTDISQLLLSFNKCNKFFSN